MNSEEVDDSRFPDDASDRETLLEHLVCGYIDRLNKGEELDPGQVIDEYPDLAAEILRELDIFRSIESGDSPDEPIGTLGDYTLRRQIGRGGMGVVYEAWQNSVDRQVALKVLPAGVAADNKAFMRFMREARTAAQLNHKNVVGVYGMGQEENTPYYSMEFVKGQTLAQILPKLRDAEAGTDTAFGPKDQDDYFERLARAFAEVAEGLHHAHSKDVIHRDIKPSNLILDQEGRLRILDFGLARIVGQESLTVTGDVVGTPLYMSPEQARQRKIEVDHRTDIYSLGATLYEMVTGRPPLRGKDHADTMSQIVTRDPAEPRKVNQRVPKDLETIILRCLRKDADDRYATAEALAQDLQLFVRGDPIEARPQGRWEKTRGRIVRNRRVIVTRILVVALLLACGALAYLVWGPERSELGGRFENPVPVQAVNSEYNTTSPTPSDDGRELYFSSLDRPDGKGDWDIYVVYRSDPGKPWGEPRNVEELNTPGVEHPGWISPDGLRLYYSRSVPGVGWWQTLYATRDEASPNAQWKPVPTEDPGVIDDAAHPFLTPDELEIYFDSGREGGVDGSMDIWVATRQSRNAPWGEPRNLEEINTSGGEFTPCISSDGRTLWWRAWPGFWYATRESRKGRFGPARRFDQPPVYSSVWSGGMRVSRNWPESGAVAYFIRATGKGKNVHIYQATWKRGWW